MIDETHSAGRRSWVASANEHADFPIRTCRSACSPPGSATQRRRDRRRIFDVATALELGLFDGLAAQAAQAAFGATLNPLFTLGGEARRALRRRVGELDADGASARVSSPAPRSRTIRTAGRAPAAIGDPPFFAGIHHAPTPASWSAPPLR
jgi:fumarylacetoacetase